MGQSSHNKIVPTDLLIIDDIGYLELENGEGWKECFSVLEGNQYYLALIVIRPELLSVAVKRYKNISVYILHDHNRIEIENKIMDDLNRFFRI